MPKTGPIKRSDLIDRFRQLGFKGPYSGGKHQFMIKGHLRVRIPNPHQRDIGQNSFLLPSALSLCEHGYFHRDVLYPGSRKEKQAIAIENLQDALQYAEQDLKDRWSWYRDRYKRRLKK